MLRGSLAILMIVVSISALIQYFMGNASDALAMLALMFITNLVGEITDNMEADAE